MVTMYVTPSQQAAARLILKLGNRRQRFDTRFLTAVAGATRASDGGRAQTSDILPPPQTQTGS